MILPRIPPLQTAESLDAKVKAAVRFGERSSDPQRLSWRLFKKARKRSLYFSGHAKPAVPAPNTLELTGHPIA